MRTTFNLPEELRDAMEAAREAAGYNRREKSRWISEAVELLPQIDPLYSSVGVGEAHLSADVTAAVSISDEAMDVIRKARATIRMELPESEGMLGQVLRAAIRNRIKHPRYWEKGGAPGGKADGKAKT